MYDNIQTRVFCDGEKSEPFYCQLGVRQGECLSRFLFAMYINDLELYLNANNSGYNGFTYENISFVVL